MCNLHPYSGELWQAPTTFYSRNNANEATQVASSLSKNKLDESPGFTNHGGKMAKFTSRKTWYLPMLLLLAAALAPTKSYAACGNVTPAFGYSKSRSCGVPVVITLSNTSTGASQNVATYSWYVGTTLIKTVVGKSGTSYQINTPGSYTFKLVAKDTGKVGCKDSTSATITINASGPKIIDGNGITSYAPSWDQCIATTGTPDTFGIFVQPNDTLFSYTIIWGDASTNSTGSQLLKTQKIYHKYSALGQFPIIIISTKNGCTDSLKGIVSNERNPVAGVIGPPSGTNSGCVPLKVRFINNSVKSSPTTTFTWDMGDGTKYILPSSTYKDTLYHTYKKSTCSGSVKVTMDNACGSSYSIWNPIQASSKDTAIVALANPGNCDLTKDFLFDNNSQTKFCGSPNPRKYKFLWGDGTQSSWLSTQAQQAHKFSARGTYTIRLIDSNSCGMDTAKLIWTIDSLPKAKAKGTPISGCSPLSVSLDDISTGKVLSRSWDFGDFTGTSSAKSPVHVYTSGGKYNAILTVGNNCGNVKDTVKISVRQKVKAGIGFISGGCAPYTVNFSNTTTAGSAGAATYYWDFGDGTTSTATNPSSKTYTTLGSVTVMLIATDSCGKDTFKRTFLVRDKPTATITVLSNRICVGSPIDIEFKTSAVNTANVIWGDGKAGTSYFGLGGGVNKTVTHTYDSAKTYIFGIYMVDPSGCSDTAKLPITINPRPTINFTYTPTNGCGPLDVKFTNTSTHNGIGTIANMTFLWNYSNGTKSYGKDSLARFNYFKTRDTIYPVKLIGTNKYGCVDSSSKSVRVYPKPLSKFSLSNLSGCAPLDITTTNNSIPYDTGSIAIMKFVWDFGNGKKAYSKDSSARYIASKTKDTVYTISLIGISEHGCMDTSYTTVRVYPKPLSRFTPSASSGCGPLKINYGNTSTPYDTGSISIMTFNWDFGNRISSTATYPSATYSDKINNDTTYIVKLIATSEHGCKDTSTKNILLHPNPKIQYNVSQNNGCGPLAVNFTNNSINGTKWSWEFGAYGKDTTRNPKKIFYGRPIFDSVVVVKLSSISKFGCFSDTVTEKITVNGTPLANYLVLKDTFCFPDPVQFLNQSLASYNYKWDLGDGTITATTNPKHFFGKSSSPFKDTTYFIKLVATSPFGCKDTARGTMTVLPYPIPKFSVDNPAGCAPHTVKFTNQSVNVKSYFWIFGDGYTSTAVNPSHTFVNTGIKDTAYHVVLYTYSADCVDSIGMWIPVYKPSYSFFRTDRVNPCDAGYFQFNSFAENAASVLYKFGDGSTSSNVNPLHLFATSPYQDTGYTITLYTTSPRGCTDSFKRSVTLAQRLQIGMKDTSWALCAPALVKFTNYTKGAVTYIWDFGDNQGSAARDPLHEYQKSGVFTYKLFAFDPNGCKDSVTSAGTIRVDQSPVADFDYNPGKGRMPNDNRIFFTSKAKSTIPITYRWDFSDPAGSPPTSTAINPSHDFSDSGNFVIRLIVDNGGCTDTAYNSVRIEPPFPTPDFTVDKDSGCPQLTVKFTNMSVNSDRYIWFFGDGDRSEDKDPVHTYRYSGYYDVTLVAKGPGGEGKTEKKYYIKVLNAPFTYFNVTPSVMFLPYATFTTRNLTTGAVGYQWNVYYSKNGANVGKSTKTDPYFTVFDTGYYDIELISVSNQGCYDTLLLTKPIYVNPKGMLYVPTAFTPTHDDRNEIFKPDVTNVQKEYYHFSIYNRWGEKVFETHDPTQGWDGTKNGKPCPIGVYVFKVGGKFLNGDDVGTEGVVTLIK